MDVQVITPPRVDHPPEEAFKVTVDLIEWFEDDTGQYQKQGLPRTFDAVFVPLRLKDDDDAIGEFLLDLFQAIYRIRPVLVSWNKDEEKERDDGQE